MRIFNASLLIALALCGALTQPAARAEDSINTAYVVTNQYGVGVVRAFDDGDNTILEFADLDRQQPVLSDAAGKKIRWHRVGEYAVLPGIVPRVMIAANGQVGVAQAAANQQPHSDLQSTTRLDPPSSEFRTEPLSTTKPVASLAKPVGGAAMKPAGSGHTVPVRTSAVSRALPWDSKSAAGGTTTSAVMAKPGAASEVPKPEPKPVVLPPPTWQARVGSTLRESMQAWATQAGWTLRWEAPGVDYPIVAPLHFAGTYVNASSAAISAYAHADRPLWVCLYTQQKLTRVTDAPCRIGGTP